MAGTVRKIEQTAPVQTKLTRVAAYARVSSRKDTIKDGFLEAFNQLIPDRDRLLEDCRIMQETLTDTSELDSQIEKLDEEMEVVTELIRKCIEENSTKAQNQED